MQLGFPKIEPVWHCYDLKQCQLRQQVLRNQLMSSTEHEENYVNMFLRFECKICLSPNERNNKEAIVWHWASLDSEALDPVEYTEHILLSPDDQSLQIYNLQVDNSGQYICELGEALTVPYFLTVINSSVNVSGVCYLYTSH